jgi:group II intron reverse transcriptase/maturase
MPYFRRTTGRSGDGNLTKLEVLTWGDLSVSLFSKVAMKDHKNDIASDREKSDGRVVPHDRRKPIRTAETRGGKATTVRQQAHQLELFRETADSPQGSDGGAGAVRTAAAPRAVPKSRHMKGSDAPAMTMEEVAADANLRMAFQEVARNRGAPGHDRKSVDEVREHLTDILAVLRVELLNGAYRPGLIRRVWIPKSGGGQRGLGIPNVVDRLVQQAVHRVMSPHYEPTFHDSSHGFRPGRSCHTAVAHAKQHLEEGHEWVVDMDLEKFFDRVHHERLLSRIAQRVHDARLVGLIRRMLKAGVAMPGGTVTHTAEGTPQGGPLSPLLSNIVLDELDQELERREHRFVRYADDCNIYVRSERAGHRVMASITSFIERRLRLKVNADKSAVALAGSRHFVGFHIGRVPMHGTIEVDVSDRTRRRLAERVKELTPRTWGQSLRDCLERINEYLIGWIGFFRVLNAPKGISLLSSTDAHIRRRLRAMLLRQRRRRRSGLARGASGRKSWWARSHTRTVEKVMPNVYFASVGLVSLAKEWQRLNPKTIAPEQLALALE